MVFALDTLGYAKHLRDSGVPGDQAEAHAEAARDFIMAELVTKQDLLAIKQDMLAFKQDFIASKQEFKQDLVATKHELETAILATKQELETAMDNLGLRLTVRLGVMLVASIGALAALLKLA